jgi:hypothetical protein
MKFIPYVFLVVVYRTQKSFGNFLDFIDSNNELQDKDSDVLLGTDILSRGLANIEANVLNSGSDSTQTDKKFSVKKTNSDHIANIDLNLLNNRPTNGKINDRNLLSNLVEINVNALNDRKEASGGFYLKNGNRESNIDKIGSNVINKNPLNPSGLLNVAVNALNNNAVNNQNFGVNVRNYNPMGKSSNSAGLLKVGINALNNDNLATNPQNPNRLVDLGISALNRDDVQTHSNPSKLLDIGINALSEKSSNFPTNPTKLIRIAVNALNKGSPTEKLLDLGINALNNPVKSVTNSATLLNIGLNVLNKNNPAGDLPNPGNMINIGINALNDDNHAKNFPNSGKTLDLGIEAMNNNQVKSITNSASFLNVGLNVLNKNNAAENLPNPGKLINLGINALNNGYSAGSPSKSGHIGLGINALNSNPSKISNIESNVLRGNNDRLGSFSRDSTNNNGFLRADPLSRSGLVNVGLNVLNSGKNPSLDYSISKGLLNTEINTLNNNYSPKRNPYQWTSALNNNRPQQENIRSDSLDLSRNSAALINGKS